MIMFKSYTAKIMSKKNENLDWGKNQHWKEVTDNDGTYDTEFCVNNSF